MAFTDRLHNRGSISGYDIDNSLKFEADNTEYLSHSSSSGSGTKVTYSFWCKRTELDSSSYMQVSGITTSSETVRFMFYQNSARVDAGNGSTGKILVTNRKFRDTSAWYHFFVVIDTTLSTEGDRHQLWVNGVRETSFSTAQYPAQNFSVATDQTNATWRYGAYDSTYYKFSGYLAECYRLDGIAASCTDFGEFDSDSGIWKPKAYLGSFGSNGHYLDFENSSSLGADASGNSNNFTLNNIAAADQAVDSPTNNFAILNTLHRVPDTTRKEGATVTVKNNNGWRTLVSTIGVTQGKWYFELEAGSEYTMIGVSGDGVYGGGSQNENYLGGLTGSTGYYGNSATFFQDGSDMSPTNVSSFTGGVIGIALDVDNGKMYFHKAGTYQNSANPNTSSNGYNLTGDAPYFLSMSTYQQSDVCKVNFGGYHNYTVSSGNADANGYGNFEYAVPSGYYALCTKNLAEFG